MKSDDDEVCMPALERSTQLSGGRKRFNEAMLDVYRRAKAEAGYNATRFLGMVTEMGGY